MHPGPNTRTRTKHSPRSAIYWCSVRHTPQPRSAQLSRICRRGLVHREHGDRNTRGRRARVHGLKIAAMVASGGWRGPLSAKGGGGSHDSTLSPLSPCSCSCSCNVCIPAIMAVSFCGKAPGTAPTHTHRGKLQLGRAAVRLTDASEPHLHSGARARHSPGVASAGPVLRCDRNVSQDGRSERRSN